MFHALLITAALVCPAQKGVCNCSTACICGCQQGKDCTCAHDGKRLPARTPPAKAKEPEKLKEPAKADETRPIGDAYPVTDGVWNFGLDKSRLGGRDKYSFGGQEISYREAMRLIEEGIPDDANKLRLTVIGAEPDRKRVLADLDSNSFAALKHLYVVQSFDPSNPIIQGLGFKTDGRPTVYLQQPDGVVLHRQDDYEGPERLATAIRRADPNYNPNNDPDLTKPKPSPGPLGPNGPDLSKVPVWLWLVMAAGVFLLLRDSGREK